MSMDIAAESFRRDELSNCLCRDMNLVEMVLWPSFSHGTAVNLSLENPQADC